MITPYKRRQCGLRQLRKQLEESISQIRCFKRELDNARDENEKLRYSLNQLREERGDFELGDPP